MNKKFLVTLVKRAFGLKKQYAYDIVSSLDDMKAEHNEVQFNEDVIITHKITGEDPDFRYHEVTVSFMEAQKLKLIVCQHVEETPTLYSKLNTIDEISYK